MSYNLAKGESVSLNSLATRKSDETSSYERIAEAQYNKIVKRMDANDLVAFATIIEMQTR